MIGSSGEPKQVCIVNRPVISRQAKYIFFLYFSRVQYTTHDACWSASDRSIYGDFTYGDVDGTEGADG